jgi:NADH-quinone oxidoreductase subunit I
LLPGMVAAPHPMVEGTDEQDYYRGKVARATPAQEQYAAARSADAVPDDGVPADGVPDDGEEGR